jgi:hypothetical protein
LEALQRSLGFEILREGVGGLQIVVQLVGFLDEVVNLDIMVIRTLPPRARQSQKQRGDN